MKKFLLIGAAAVAAGGIAATPAIAGIVGNSSFSHEIPVRVPTQAQAPQLVGNHSPAGDDRPSATTSRHTEPGDDRGATSRQPEPGDDHGGARTASEPGDDHGSASTAPEPGDDHGGVGRAPEPSDDSGGHGGGGHRSDG